MHRGRGLGRGGMTGRGWRGGDHPLLWLARTGFMVLLLAVAVAGVVYLLRSRRRPVAAAAGVPVAPVAPVVTAPASVVASDDAAAAHLRMRYARGEVSRDEYLRTAADLGMAVPAASGTVAPSPDPVI